jgi:dimethylargininase
MFTNAIVRPPCARFAEGLTTINLGAPNPTLALQQHAAYCEALEACGLRLTRLDADERYPDSTFVEDTAVIIRALSHGRASAQAASAACAILTRPGAFSRAGEVESIAATLSRLSQEIHSIREPGTLDGGDVCEAEDHFFIGISERTNEAGANQLAKLLASHGYPSSFVDIRRVKNVLHLKSGLAYLGDDRLAVIDALADHKEIRRYDLVRVNATEQYAANCVRINDYVLVVDGFPEFEGALQNRGYKTLSVEMTEFQKMDGGLSCLSLRF